MNSINYSKSFFLDQHGCAKNQVDGELIITRLLNLGWEMAEAPENASLIIVNSCGFIESAKKESLDAVLTAKSQHPRAKVLLAGCLAERYASMLQEELPEADAIFGNGDLSKLDSFIAELEKQHRPVATFPQKGVCMGERKKFLNFPRSVYIKITEGCDNRCTFCAIPLIRGSLRSRNEDDIVDEIKNLLDNNMFEFNLIGQDLAAYGYDGKIPPSPFEFVEHESPLAHLLKKISTIEGDFWIRLLYIHPDHFPLDILPIIQQDKRILPYFDIPFQSGDESIIHKMNRRGNAQTYTQLIETIRMSLPEAVLRTTFLCGFPGETDEAATNTAFFLKAIKPQWSGCFTYSKEEDTPAYAFRNPVPKKKAAERVHTLSVMQEEITMHSLHAYVNKLLTVLVEEVIRGEDDGDFALARAWFQAPDVDGACVVRLEAGQDISAGDVVGIFVDGVRGLDLVGNIII